MTENTDAFAINSIEKYKLVILGETAVGKSSIIQQYVNNKFTNLHQPTIGGLYFSKQVEVDGKVIKFEIWDTAGQERFHSLTPIYYKNAKIAVVVFDITNTTSFERAQKWVKELLEQANPGILICLCGNKIDLVENRVVQKEEGEKYAEEIGSFYCEVSAKVNLGVEEMFNEIIKRLPIFKEEDNWMKLEDNNNRSSKNNYCNSYC